MYYSFSCLLLQFYVINHEVDYILHKFAEVCLLFDIWVSTVDRADWCDRVVYMCLYIWGLFLSHSGTINIEIYLTPQQIRPYYYHKMIPSIDKSEKITNYKKLMLRWVEFTKIRKNHNLMRLFLFELNFQQCTAARHQCRDYQSPLSRGEAMDRDGSFAENKNNALRRIYASAILPHCKVLHRTAHIKGSQLHWHSMPLCTWCSCKCTHGDHERSRGEQQRRHRWMCTL